MEDPVCGMSVDEGKTELKSERDGETFCFCSKACKSAFDKGPRRFHR